jgi:hypothetical protein
MRIHRSTTCSGNCQWRLMKVQSTYQFPHLHHSFLTPHQRKGSLFNVEFWNITIFIVKHWFTTDQPTPQNQKHCKRCSHITAKTSTSEHATSMWLIFTITTADNLTFFHCKRFEFTCDVKSFLDKNSNHSLSPSPLAWFSCKQRYFHFTMTKMPRRPPCRPYLLPSIDFNAENIGFLPPSSQPIVRCARTIWAAIKFGPSPVAFAIVSVRIHEFGEMAPLLLST